MTGEIKEEQYVFTKYLGNEEIYTEINITNINGGTNDLYHLTNEQWNKLEDYLLKELD